MLVETKLFKINEPVHLESGKELPQVDIAYETYGKLNENGDNAILLLHALTGDAHAAGYHQGDKKPGWWDDMVGSGKAFDTDKYFVICSNMLGGCKGTTGPNSINPATGVEYGLSFPVITIEDVVKVQKKLTDFLGVKKLIVAGGSMGGMQALEWALSYGDMVSHVIVIASTPRLSAQSIAFNAVGRNAILSDPNFNNGNYYHAVEEADIEEGAFDLISSDIAKNYYLTQEYPLIYSNSENAITWVLKNLPDSNLSNYIKLFKDKIAFREMLQEMFPDFYFKAVEFDELKKMTPDGIRFPVVVKPSVGFLSFGVHTIKESKEWKDVISQLEKEMRMAAMMYPNHVVNSTKFLIEEMIEGEEYAVDAYFDRDGEPVILNIFQHPFLNSKDVSDRIYLMSVGIMTKYMAKFGLLLREIGQLKNIKNFPVHIELRVTKDGKIIPIEVNPMRFAGWCTTDVAKYAWGINVYEYFYDQKKPNWNEILANATRDVFYFSMAEVPANFDRKKYKGFEYERFLSNYSNVLEVRRINPLDNPLFAIIFGSTTSKEEVVKILSLKTQDYIKS